MAESTHTKSADLFGNENEEDKKTSKEDNTEKRKQFLNAMSEDDIKRKHNETHEELRKNKR